jgi:hypothetical protein
MGSVHEKGSIPLTEYYTDLPSTLNKWLLAQRLC